MKVNIKITNGVDMVDAYIIMNITKENIIIIWDMDKGNISK